MATENARRMYSAAYQEGQRLAHVPSALAKVEADAVDDSDPYYISLDSPSWTAGFQDGWYGRVPVHALRLADFDLWDVG